MKKLVAILVFISFALAMQAENVVNYVSVNGKHYFSNAVKIGLLNVRISTDNGMTLKAPLKKVDAMMVDGKLLERLPVICLNGKNKGTALMELVAQRNGLKLYKYYPTENPDQSCCFHDKSQQTCVFFIYRDKELYLHVDNKNAETVFPFFHVTFNNVSEA